MTETLVESPRIQSTATSAARKTARNWAANSNALRATQPNLVENLQPMATGVEWVFARDGSLTAMEDGNRWWAGCSLPTRAAEFMLRKAELPGTVICFLYPVHAGQIRVALDRMLPGQALIALTQEWPTFRMILACEDFSAEIAAHRLYFAAGEQWESELDRLLEENPGLPTPTQFIRPILANSAPADLLVAPAQKIFAEHSRLRGERVRTLRQNWKSAGLRRICVVAPSHFRLWDDIGHALASVMKADVDGIAAMQFDPDDPASASPAALSSAAAGCDAIVAPNSSRADLPDLVADEMPWATWLTMPRIPPADKAGPRDTLLVADPSWKELAIQRGWDAARVFPAGWPDLQTCVDAADAPASHGVLWVPNKPILAIISNTQSLEPPQRVTEYSSHRLFWEAIHDELLQNPFALGRSADDYLSQWMRKARVDEEGFDRALFLDGIILHAWPQGIARALLRAGLPFELHGSGWSDVEDLRACAAGAVRNRQELRLAIRSATALVHIRPIAHAHPIESAGKAVVIPDRQRESFLRDAKLALSGRLPARGRSVPRLSSKTILQALRV